MTLGTGGTSLLTLRPSANFIKADTSVRLSLVKDIVKTWDLATFGASDPPKVSEEEMAMANVFAKAVKTVEECQRLEGLVPRYQTRCEMLQADIEARESEKRNCSAI